MRHYTQLAQEQRYQIFALMEAGNSQTDIQVFLNINPTVALAS